MLNSIETVRTKKTKSHNENTFLGKDVEVVEYETQTYGTHQQLLHSIEVMTDQCK